MKQIQDLLRHVMEHGTDKDDRTGTGTRSVFGYQMRFDLRYGFPLDTTKKLHTRSIIHELLWFLNGDTNNKYLEDNKVRIWREWCDENGDLGRIYGAQWRRWNSNNGESIDQITNLIERIKTNPDCRRLIVTAWNPSDLPDTTKSFSENIKNDKAALAWCHTMFQCYTRIMHPNERLWEFKKKYVDMLDEWDLKQSEYEYKMDEMNFPTRYIDLQLYQRSCDAGLGLYFNIPSYALLLMMIAQEVNMIPCDFIHSFGDLHIYKNHFDAIEEILKREPRDLPTMKLNPNIKKVLDFRYEDFELVGYDPHPTIKMKVSV